MAERLVFAPSDPMLQMIEGLSPISDISAATLKTLGDALEKQTGFFETEALTELISKSVPDKSQGAAVFTAIRNLRPDGIPQVLEMIQSWRGTSEENKRLLSDEQFQALERNLPVLIRKYPSISRAQKAERLRTILGNEVEGFVFICDARPVYNEARDAIEGQNKKDRARRTA